jgi:hypothetical protein
MADEGEARRALCGWDSDFPTFERTPARVIRTRLEGFVRDASAEQISVWDASIPELQREVAEVLSRVGGASEYTAILEYELPLESRRPDAIFLAGVGVVVVELKGKAFPSRADIDQAAAYVRDLRSYHAECHARSVLGVLIPTHGRGRMGERSGIQICGPDALDELIGEFARQPGGEPVLPSAFLASDAYAPLPSLLEAARELFHSRSLRTIWRAKAATDPAVSTLTDIVHQAAAAKRRKLILLTGSPGTGKTLVGLRIVHADYLSDLAIQTSRRRGAAPAVFLSGNQPLVQVLQYEMRGAGGGGKAFVRPVKEYVKHYSAKKDRLPPEHVLVFDEAQRAFDAAQVAAKHLKTPGYGGGKSEPELFVEFAERVPEWCVVLALIGDGQEIHVGEEGGLVQWRAAVEGGTKAAWEVYGPPSLRSTFEGCSVPFHAREELQLREELRFHWANDLHTFVNGLITQRKPDALAAIARELARVGYHLRITRDLEQAKHYLRERYADHKKARFGLLASSRDQVLPLYGVANGFNATKNVRPGPWYADDESSSRSCRRLTDCMTEFGAQGLELDAALLAWGTDFQWRGDAWSSERTRKYKEHKRVKSIHQLRVNAYRVLLTRAREANVVFVPSLTELDLTYGRLRDSGFLDLRDDQ